MDTLNEIHNNTKINAEKNLTDLFPLKIIKLNKMLLSDNYNVEKINSIKTNSKLTTEKCGDDDKDFKKLDKSDNSNMHDDQEKFLVNEIIITLANEVKPIIHECLDDVQMLELWIQLNVPKIEDGNNFGVSIQEKILERLGEIESELLVRLEFFSEYHYYRAKLLAKHYKYPSVVDFKMSVIEYDRSIIVQIREMIQDIRNYYAILYDIFMKNLVKLKKPRSDNGVSYAIS